MAVLLTAGWSLAGCSIFRGEQSIQHIDELDETQYASLRVRVKAWAGTIAAEIIKAEPRTREELSLIAAFLLAMDDPTPQALAEVVSPPGVQWSSPLITALFLEVQAYLDERGIGATTRRRDLFDAVAEGISDVVDVPVDSPAEPR